jgi:hypothetical protein
MLPYAKMSDPQFQCGYYWISVDYFAYRSKETFSFDGAGTVYSREFWWFITLTSIFLWWSWASSTASWIVLTLLTARPASKKSCSHSSLQRSNNTVTHTVTHTHTHTHTHSEGRGCINTHLPLLASSCSSAARKASKFLLRLLELEKSSWSSQSSVPRTPQSVTKSLGW